MDCQCEVMSNLLTGPRRQQVRVGSLLNFVDEPELEMHFLAHQAASRLPLDSMAAAVELFTSTGFAFKLRESLLPGGAPAVQPLAWPTMTMVFCVETSHRLLPAAVRLILGRRRYLVHRCMVMAMARVLKIAWMVVCLLWGSGTPSADYCLGGIYTSLAGQATYPLFNQLHFGMHAPIQLAMLFVSSAFLGSCGGGICTSIARLASFATGMGMVAAPSVSPCRPGQLLWDAPGQFDMGSQPGIEDCARLQRSTQEAASAANSVVTALLPGLSLRVQPTEGCRVLWLVALMAISCAATMVVYIMEARQRDAFLEARGLRAKGGSCDCLCPLLRFHWPVLPLAGIAYWSLVVRLTGSA